jgi:hypothetical protein
MQRMITRTKNERMGAGWIICPVITGAKVFREEYNQGISKIIVNMMMVI